jgi:xanthine dehydrogenase small subunit
MDRQAPMAWLTTHNFLPAYFLEIPKRLEGLGAPPRTEDGYVLAGGTDLLIQDFHGAQDAPRVELLSTREELRRIRVGDGWCEIGAACTVSQLMESPELNAVIPGLEGYLGLIASHPIRNMGTVGGNLANASPLGDLAVLLTGLGATLRLSREGRIREMPLRKFFAGYKQTILEPGEIIVGVEFETLDPRTRFSFEKSSKRRHLDMATVNSALRITLEDGPDGRIVRKAIFAAGCLGPTVLHLKETSAFLVGRRLDAETFKEANRIAQGEVSPISRHPGDGEYKRALLRQHLLIHLMKFSPQTLGLEALA